LLEEFNLVIYWQRKDIGGVWGDTEQFWRRFLLEAYIQFHWLTPTEVRRFGRIVVPHLRTSFIKMRQKRRCMPKKTKISSKPIKNRKLEVKA